METIKLWGGAASADIPGGLSDCSNFRDVPDNQEVYIDTTGNFSAIFEIVEYQHQVQDHGAAEFFYYDLMGENAALEFDANSGMLAGIADRKDSDGHGMYFQSGRMRAKKATGGQNEGVHEVSIRLCVIRIPEHNAEVIITINQGLPQVLAQNVLNEYSNKELDDFIGRIAGSFTISNYSLFS